MDNNIEILQDYLQGIRYGRTDIDLDTTSLLNRKNIRGNASAPGYNWYEYLGDAAASYYRSVQEGEMQANQDRMLQATNNKKYAKLAQSNNEDEKIEGISTLRKLGLWTEKKDPTNQELQEIIDEQDKTFAEEEASYFHNKDQRDNNAFFGVNNYDISQYYTNKSNEAVQGWGNWMYKMPATAGTSMTSPVWQAIGLGGAAVGSKFGAAAGAWAAAKAGAAIGSAGGLIGTGIGFVLGGLLGGALGSVKSRQEESHMEAFNGYYEKMMQLAEDKKVDMNKVREKVSAQLQERGIDTSTMTPQQIIQAALADPTLDTFSSGFAESAKDAYVESRRLFERNNALGFGEAVSDLTYLLPVGSLSKPFTAVVKKTLGATTSKLVPNALKVAAAKRFKAGLNVAASGAVARNKRLLGDLRKLATDTTIRGMIEASEEGAQNFLVKEYLNGEYADENVNQTFLDAVADGQVFTDLGHDIWLRTKSMGAAFGLYPEYKDDQQLFEEMGSGFLLSLFNPFGTASLVSRANGEIQTLLTIPKVAKHLEHTLSTQDEVNRSKEFFKNVREGLPSGRAWTEALDELKKELKTVGPDGKTKKYNLDATVLTDGQTPATEDQVDEHIEEQKKEAVAMIGYSREMRKKLQNVEDLSDDDADLYMALGYNANKEASQASKILKEYEKEGGKITAVVTDRSQDEDFQQEIKDAKFTKDELNEADFRSFAALSLLNKEIQHVQEKSQAIKKQEEIKKIMAEKKMLSQESHIEEAETALAYITHLTKLQMQRDAIVRDLMTAHPDIKKSDLILSDVITDAAQSFSVEALADNNSIEKVARDHSDITVLGTLLNLKNMQYQDAKKDFVRNVVAKYKETQTRQNNLADASNEAAKTNTEVKEGATVINDTKVQDMTKQQMEEEQAYINEQITSTADELHTLLDSIPENSYLRSFAEYLNRGAELTNTPEEYVRYVSRATNRIKYQYQKGDQFENASEEEKKILKEITDISENMAKQLDRVLRISAESRARAQRKNAGFKAEHTVWQDASGNRYVVRQNEAEYSENEGLILTLQPVSDASDEKHIDKLLENVAKQKERLTKDSEENPENKEANDKIVETLDVIADNLTRQKENPSQNKIIMRTDQNREWLSSLKTVNNEGKETLYASKLTRLENLVANDIAENKKKRALRTELVSSTGDVFDFEENEKETEKVKPTWREKLVQAEMGKVNKVKAYPIPNDKQSNKAARTKLLNPYHQARFWRGHIAAPYFSVQEAKKYVKDDHFTVKGETYSRYKAVEFFNKLGEKIAELKQNKKYNPVELYELLEKFAKNEETAANYNGVSITKEAYKNLIYSLPLTALMFQPRTGKQSTFVVLSDFSSASRSETVNNEEFNARAGLIHDLLNNYKLVKKDADLSKEGFTEEEVENTFRSRVYFSDKQVEIVYGDFDYSIQTKVNPQSRFFTKDDGTQMSASEINQYYTSASAEATARVMDNMEEFLSLLKDLQFDVTEEDLNKQLDGGETALSSVVKGLIRYGHGATKLDTLWGNYIRKNLGLAGNTKSPKESQRLRAKKLLQFVQSVSPESFLTYTKNTDNSEFATPIEITVEDAIKGRWFNGSSSIRVFERNQQTQEYEELKYSNTPESIQKTTKMFQDFEKVLNQSKNAQEFISQLKDLGYQFVQHGKAEVAEETLTDYFFNKKFSMLTKPSNIAQVFTYGSSTPNGNAVNYDDFNTVSYHVNHKISEVKSLGLQKDENGRYVFSLEKWLSRNTKDKVQKDPQEQTDLDAQLEEAFKPYDTILEKISGMKGRNANETKEQRVDYLTELVQVHSFLQPVLDSLYRSKTKKEKEGSDESTKNDKVLKSGITPGIILDRVEEAINEEKNKLSEEITKKYISDIAAEVKADDAFAGYDTAPLQFAFGSFNTDGGASIIYYDQKGEKHTMKNASGTAGAIYLVLPRFLNSAHKEYPVKLNPKYMDENMATFIADMFNAVRMGKLKMDQFINEFTTDNGYTVKTQMTVQQLIDRFIYTGTDAIINNPNDNNYRRLLYFNKNTGDVRFGTTSTLNNDNFADFVKFIMENKPYRVDSKKLANTSAVVGNDLEITKDGNVVFKEDANDNYVASVVDNGWLQTDLNTDESSNIFVNPSVYIRYRSDRKFTGLPNDPVQQGSAANARKQLGEEMSREETVEWSNDKTTGLSVLSAGDNAATYVTKVFDIFDHFVNKVSDLLDTNKKYYAAILDKEGKPSGVPGSENQAAVRYAQGEGVKEGWGIQRGGKFHGLVSGLAERKSLSIVLVDENNNPILDEKGKMITAYFDTAKMQKAQQPTQQTQQGTAQTQASAVGIDYSTLPAGSTIQQPDGTVIVIGGGSATTGVVAQNTRMVPFQEPVHVTSSVQTSIPLRWSNADVDFSLDVTQEDLKDASGNTITVKQLIDDYVLEYSDNLTQEDAEDMRQSLYQQAGLAQTGTESVGINPLADLGGMGRQAPTAADAVKQGLQPQSQPKTTVNPRSEVAPKDVSEWATKNAAELVQSARSAKESAIVQNAIKNIIARYYNAVGIESNPVKAVKLIESNPQLIYKVSAELFGSTPKFASVMQFVSEHVEKEDYSTALENVKRILGENFPVYTFAEEETAWDSSREAMIYVFGECLSNGIRIFKDARSGKIAKNSLYHESFHRVSLFLLSEKSRQKMYADAREKWQELQDKNDKQVEEFLADQFAVYIQDRGNNVETKHVGILAKMFKKLYDSILSGIRRLTGMNITPKYHNMDKLFEDMRAGRYAYAKATSNNLELFKKVYGDSNPFSGIMYKDVQVAKNARQYDEIKRDLLGRLLRTSSIQILENGKLQVNTEAVKKALKDQLGTYKEALSELEKNVASGLENLPAGFSKDDVYEAVILMSNMINVYEKIIETKQWDAWKEILTKFCDKQFNAEFDDTNNPEQIINDNIDTYGEFESNAVTDSISKNRDSYLKDAFKSLDVSMKMFIWSVTDTNLQDASGAKFTSDGLIRYSNVAALFNKLARSIDTAENTEDMLEKLKVAAFRYRDQMNDNTVMQVYQMLTDKQTSQAFVNRFFSDFVRHIHRFTYHDYSTKEIVDDKGKVVDVEYVSASTRSGDETAVNDNLLIHWKRGIKNALVAIGSVSRESVGFSSKNLRQILKPLADAVKSVKSSDKKSVINLLQQLEATFGISFNMDHSAMAELVTKSDDSGTFNLLKNVAKKLSSITTTDLQNELNSKKKFGSKIIKDLFDLKGDLNVLAERIGKKLPSDYKNNSQRGPEGVKIYTIGSHNFITRLFDARIRSKSWRERMLRNPYAVNSTWLQEILRGNTAIYADTKLATMVNEDFHESVADIDITEIEDILNRFTTTLEGNHTIPSLANKRFAAEIVGIPNDIAHYFDEDLTINRNIVKRFVDYLADEILAVADAMKTRELFLQEIYEATGKKYTAKDFSNLSPREQEELFKTNENAAKALRLLRKQYHFVEGKAEFVNKPGSAQRIVKRAFHIDLQQGSGYQFRHFKNLGRDIKLTQDQINQMTKGLFEHDRDLLSARKIAVGIANEYQNGIKTILRRNIAITTKKLSQLGLIFDVNSNVATGYVAIEDLKNKYLPKNLFANIDPSLKNKIEQIKSDAIPSATLYKAIGVFTISNMMDNLEFEKIVSGDIGFHKDITSVNKRYSGITSTIQITSEKSTVLNAFDEDRLNDSETFNVVTANTSLVVNTAKFEGDMRNVLGADVVTGYTVKGKNVVEDVDLGFSIASKGTITPITDYTVLLDENKNLTKSAKKSPLIARYLEHADNGRRKGINENGEPLSDEMLAKAAVEDAVNRFIGYLNNDPTDASVFITAEMYRQLRQREGKWNVVDEACYNLLEHYDEITGPNGLVNRNEKAVREMCAVLKINYDELLKREAEYKKDPAKNANQYKGWILGITSGFHTTSLKYVYYGETADNASGLYVPTYDKMSLSPIFKIYAKGHQMEEILKFMRSKQIDMLKLESAVKSGGVASFELFDENGNFNKKAMNNSVIQSQYFELIGKQLNTETSHNETADLLTQFMKIAMMNIKPSTKYNVGGTNITGKQMLDLYKSLLDELTERGYTKFKKMYGITENGVDKQQFMEKLKDMAETQGMPLETLAAMATFNGEYGIHPAGLPNITWIQSRILAEMGKTVINTTTPGMPLFQVASVGYDNIFNLKKHKDTRLLMPGEIKRDGTINQRMQVKLSISFFDDVIKQAKKQKIKGYDFNNFDDQRRFILENQELFALSYRVPTQGQNSTIPVEIVDLFPSQRGSIISFPAGITAQTGSDFDIDKMFLARPNYEVVDGKVQKIKYNLNDILKSTKNIDEKMLQNCLLDMYQAVLTSKEHYLAANTPLDVCTAPLKDFAVSLMDKRNRVEGSFDDTVDGYYLNPIFQTAQKVKNAGSDNGIGPMALNSVFRFFTQVAGLKLRNDDFLKDLGIKSISELFDRNGEDILDITSALINAHVDAVKDNYIGAMNVNGYTYDITAFMTSAGFGNDTFAFLTQPVLVSVAKNWQNWKQGHIGVNPQLSKGSRYLDVVKDEYTDFAGRPVFEMASAKEMEIDYLKAQADVPQDQRSAEWYAQQIRYLNTFIRLNEKAQAYHDAITVAQIDTKKYGISADQIISFMQLMDRVVSPYNDTFENPEVLFNDTFLGKKYLEGVLGMFNAFNQTIFEFSEIYKNTADELSKQYGKYGKFSKNFLRVVGPRIKAAMLLPFFNEYLFNRFPKTTVPLLSLTTGPNSVGARFNKIKTAALLEGIGDDFFLNVKYNPLFESKNPQFFNINDDVRNDETTKSAVQMAISDLFNSGNREIEEWIKDFAVYMFYVTAGTDSNAGGLIKTSLFDLLPPQHLANITAGSYGTYNDYISKYVMDPSRLGHGSLPQSMLDLIMEMVATSDDEIVPVIKADNRMFPFNDKSVAYISYGSYELMQREQGTFQKFIKLKDANGVVTLYKLGDIALVKAKNGNVYANPIYYRITPLGYRNSKLSAYSLRADGYVDTKTGNIKSLFNADVNSSASNHTELDEKQQAALVKRISPLAMIPADEVIDFSKYSNSDDVMRVFGVNVAVDASDVVYFVPSGVPSESLMKEYSEYKGKEFHVITSTDDVIPVSDEHRSVLVVGDEENPVVQQILDAVGGKEVNRMDFSGVKMHNSQESQNNESNKTTSAQTRFTTARSSDYKQRTIDNAVWSDITLAFAEDFSTSGEELTAKSAKNKYAPIRMSKRTIDRAKLEQVAEKAKALNRPVKINIAGNGIYTLFGKGWTQEEVNSYVEESLKYLQSQGVVISEIRSGGQTGVDEAGIIAAQKLGIPNEVHTTSNWKFRNEKGVDITNEKAFKARFISDKQLNLFEDNPDIVQQHQNETKKQRPSEKC